MPPIILPFDAAFSDVTALGPAVSLVTYNVLLPNCDDGWWVFKYYDSSTPHAAREWSHRQALLRRTLLGVRADLLCLQETRGDGLSDDFGYLHQAGYQSAQYRKGRMRPATFWRDADWELLHTRHTDKVLGTILRRRAHPQHVLGLLNGHLTAAPDPRRRFRQVFDGLDGLRKDLGRLGIDPQDAAVVMCGDFNAAPEGSATHHVLAGGAVGADFREPAWPQRVLSSKTRRHLFSPMVEVYQQALAEPPVTLLGGRVQGLLDDGQPTARLFAAIDAMFDVLSAGTERMQTEAVDGWIRRINLASGRGSEHHKAQARMAERGRAWLSRDDFLAVYRSELEEGKYWSVQHDLQAFDLVPDGERSLYAASLDRIYCSSATLEPLAVWDPLTHDQRSQLMREGRGLPNDWHPSDHLPLGAVLQWR